MHIILEKKYLFILACTGTLIHWGREQLPPNLSLAPTCDTEHCLTNSKHQHINAKSSFLWLSNYAKMRFRSRVPPGPHWGSSQSSPNPQLAGEGTPLSIPHPTRHLRCLDSLSFSARRSPLGASIWWQCSKHFSLERRRSVRLNNSVLSAPITDRQTDI